MTDRPASAAPANGADDDHEDDQPAPRRAKKGEDAKFLAAFEAAEKALGGNDKPKAKSKPKAKVEDDDDDDDEDEDEKPARPAKKKPAKPSKKEVADDDDEDDEDDDDFVARNRQSESGKQPKDGEKKPAKAAEKPAEKDKDGKEPLKPKGWWSHERRSSFNYQPRHVQEQWLEEAPAPNAHWPEEFKERFASVPREAQEILLEQSQSLERGFNEKFQALNAERKLAETIKSAITPQQRQMMQQRGLDEGRTFQALMHLQEQSMRDPVGYARDFIMRNKLDPRAILGNAGGEGGENGQNPAPAADIASHPTVRALQAEVQAMKAAQMEDARRRDEENDRKIETDMSGVLAETDDEGNPAYPYARLLAAPMAQILLADPAKYDAMGVRERFVTAYNLALKDFPELQPPPKAAKSSKKADEPDEDADPDEEDEEEVKLKRAATKKSKRPAATSQSREDSWGKAFRRAEKQLGQR